MGHVSVANTLSDDYVTGHLKKASVQNKSLEMHCTSMKKLKKLFYAIGMCSLLSLINVARSWADEPGSLQAPSTPGVFHGKMFYGLNGNVFAQINLRWTTDRQLIGELVQGEHQQRLTDKHLGFVGSVQRLRGYAEEFHFCDVGIEEVLAPSRSDVIETWPPGVGKMRLIWSSGTLSPGVSDGTRGSLNGQPPLEIPKPEKPMRSVLPVDWVAEKELHGDWIASAADQVDSPSQIYRFGPSQLSVITDGQISLVMSYISRPDLSSRALDVIYFADGGISVSRMIYQVDNETLQIAFGPPNAPRPNSFEPGIGNKITNMRRSKQPVQVASEAPPSEELLAGLRHDGSRLEKTQQRAILQRLLSSQTAIDRGFLAVVCAAGHFGVTEHLARAQSLVNPHLDAIRVAASGDSAMAKFLLWRLVDLEVIPESEFNAMEYLQDAAESGLPNAQWRLAKQQMAEYKQSESAYQWLIRASPRDARAREELAFWHLNENRKWRKTEELAWVLTLAGARDACSDLHTQISVAYETGQRDKADLEAAIAWSESGANLGNSIGMHNLGVHALNAKQYDKAFSCFEKAAVSGLEDAKVKLAEMYLYGQGIEQDLAKAKETLADVDNHDARTLLAKIEVNPQDGSLRLRKERVFWNAPGDDGEFGQAAYDRNMRNMRSTMRQNIGRRTGVFFED